MNCKICLNPEKCDCLCSTCAGIRLHQHFIGEDAAYKRLTENAHDLAKLRRIVKDLTFECREGMIGYAAFDLERNPNNLAAKRINALCRLENK